MEEEKLKTVSTDNSLEEIYCKREERNEQLPTRGAESNEVLFHLMREITAHGITMGMMH